MQGGRHGENRKVRVEGKGLTKVGDGSQSRCIIEKERGGGGGDGHGRRSRRKADTHTQTDLHSIYDGR